MSRSKLFVVLTLVAIAASWGGTAYAGIEVGNAVFAAGRANLMVGNRSVGTVMGGQELKVTAVQGQWIGTKVNVGGKEVAGWLMNSQLVTSKEALAQRSTTRSFSAQPTTQGTTSTTRSYSYSPGYRSGGGNRMPAYALPRADARKSR